MDYGVCFTFNLSSRFWTANMQEKNVINPTLTVDRRYNFLIIMSGLLMPHHHKQWQK